MINDQDKDMETERRKGNGGMVVHQPLLFLYMIFFTIGKQRKKNMKIFVSIHLPW